MDSEHKQSSEKEVQQKKAEKLSTAQIVHQQTKHFNENVQLSAAAAARSEGKAWQQLASMTKVAGS